MIYRFFILVFIFSISLNAQIEFEFDDLEYTTLKTQAIKIGTPKSNFDKIFKDCTELNNCVFEEEGSEIFLGTYHVNKTKSLLFYYTSGSSEDPQIYVTLNNKIILNVLAETFHIKGKIIYVEGLSNNFFNRKRKFKFDGIAFKEVRQPISYVGVDGLLKQGITIYQSKLLKKPVAYLPKEYLIEIIAVEFDEKNESIEYLLIKTDYGLVGWLDFKLDYYGGKLINDFRNFGD